MTDETIDRSEALAAFIRFADQMHDIREQYDRPAYAETCSCGARIEVNRVVTGAERRRLVVQWFTKHRGCTGTPLAPVLGQVGRGNDADS